MLTQRGSTVLEGFVMIAIVALFLSATASYISYVQAKSRDARRIVDVGQLTKAFNLYANNHQGYPRAIEPIALTGSDAVSVSLIAEGIIPQPIADPLSPKLSYLYQSNRAGNDFGIRFCLETDTIPGYARGCDNVQTP